MQFKDNKNNFTFSGTLSDCSFAIGSGVKDKNSIEAPTSVEVHPIEKAISEAKEYIYIISPYVSESEVQKLIAHYHLIKKNNPNSNLKLKLLFSYTSSNKNKPDENYLKSFRKFIDKLNFNKFKDEVKVIKDKYNQKKEETNDEKLKIKSYMKFLYFLCFLSPICLGFLYYFNQFSKFTLIPLGVVFVGSIIRLHLLEEKNRNLDLQKITLNKNETDEIKELKTIPPEIEWKNIEFKILKNKYKEEKNRNLDLQKITLNKNETDEIKELKTIPPEIEWKNIEFKILKNKYNSSLDKEPLIHTKLYLMDCPQSENGSDTVAFLGSVNFTYSAFYKNQEFLFKTTNKDFTNKLLDYFNNLYDSDNFQILTKEEIIQFLFNEDLIFYPKNID